MVEEYKFIFKEAINKRVIELSDVNTEMIYQHFMENIDEVIYINKSGKIYGIITPGDLYRHFRSCQTEPLINVNFSSVSEWNIALAEEIIKKIPSIHEVPVVKNGLFVGIISNGKVKSEKSWYEIRNSLYWYTPECIEWAYSHIRNFMKKNEDIKIYLYLSPVKFVCMHNTDQKLLIENVTYKIKNKLKYSHRHYGFSQMTEDEYKAYFKEMYTEKYVEQFIDDMSKWSICQKNGVYKFSDISSANYNVINGYRLNNRKINATSRKILFLGPCIWFGAYVDDKHTIECYLQDLVNKNAYEVINCGNLGNWSLDRLLTEKVCSDDIFIIYSNWYSENKAWLRCADEFPNINIRTNLAEAYNIEKVDENLFNAVVHCNHIINERIANIIYNDIKHELSQSDSISAEIKREALQDYYISWDVFFFYRNYFKQNNISKLDSNLKKGSIVMNCNPFTKGHRYLIEQAAKQVDFLYIFVVEEDKSEFKFEDRFNMVKLGVQDLQNVMVIPSGKYIISQETFSQYFEKDTVEEINSMDYDIHIFAEVIAKELDITCRFAGEEPFDKVTKNYNETMARILPAEGIEFIEIPRATTENNDVISASTVRRLIAEKQYEKLNDYLPETTINYIREHINHDI